MKSHGEGDERRQLGKQRPVHVWNDSVQICFDEFKTFI